MSTTQQKIAVMQAHTDGQRIQFLPKNSTDRARWNTLDDDCVPCWNWDAGEYRVAVATPVRLRGYMHSYFGLRWFPDYEKVDTAEFHRVPTEDKVVMVIV